MSKMVVVVVPAHNEESNIRKVVEESSKHADRVIVIDDGSADRTSEEAQLGSRKVIVLRHRVNLGKGAALKTGCQAAVALAADIIVTIDGDGQHPVEHIPLMVKEMMANNWQVVFSVRQGGDRMPLVRLWGNYFLNLVARNFFNLKLRDMWCGFRAIRADVLPVIDWQNSDYSGEIQMALMVGRSGLAYGEYIIPTVYSDRFRGVSIFHGLKLLAQMVIWRIII